MNITLAWRLARAIVHLLAGLAICAFVFPWAGAPARARLTRRWSRQLLVLCRVQLEPCDRAPALEHAMIVANHVSWLDIFVINSVHPCRFVAKAEIRAWPVLGWLVERAGTVFIARGNRRDLRGIFKGMVDVLRQGQRVAFFPEGTTAMQGQVLPFHANLFEAAIDAGVAVQPYAIEYVDAGGAHHTSVDYIGETTFVRSFIAILSGPPVRVRLSCLAPIGSAGAQRRELAQQARDAVASALTAHAPAPAAGIATPARA
ncbi:lysophospholipid acyltransferase family protein [Massilia terrae]|uniref:1-acyl-sn-glycerol-3-phosphate acyltransferase n=1 Tax=Massilia terrae TaxID=1811224 RepID=A0ABT2CXJ1_9BURK|nr:lysophospholipid acyltransferase family protein [Massilia terrae]MCS0658510.1 1-acyl-sn-glycerol-3-phosphate acyltransferase [Massilia terrae]